MPGQTEGQKDRRMDKNLFYGTIPATTGGPIILKYTFEIWYYGKSSIYIFQELFASIDKIFILGGRLSTRL